MRNVIGKKKKIITDIPKSRSLPKSPFFEDRKSGKITVAYKRLITDMLIKRTPSEVKIVKFFEWLGFKYITAYLRDFNETNDAAMPSVKYKIVVSV